jgi:hypothetical protein
MTTDRLVVGSPSVFAPTSQHAADDGQRGMWVLDDLEEC